MCVCVRLQGKNYFRLRFIGGKPEMVESANFFGKKPSDFFDRNANFWSIFDDFPCVFRMESQKFLGRPYRAGRGRSPSGPILGRRVKRKRERERERERER